MFILVGLEAVEIGVGDRGDNALEVAWHVKVLGEDMEIIWHIFIL